jgi:hypothetical protein
MIITLVTYFNIGNQYFYHRLYLEQIFCTTFRINSDYLPLHHLTRLHNGEMCLE